MLGIDILTAVLIGIAAGWIAERALNRRLGLFLNLIVGVVGSFVGAFLVRSLHIPYSGFFASLVVSTFGAVLLLALLSLAARK